MLSFIATVLTVLSLLTYFIPLIFRLIPRPPQNLAVKYSSTWAFVSGGSSGIGLSIVERLASQGINVGDNLIVLYVGDNCRS
jgi:hypothetical protein